MPPEFVEVFSSHVDAVGFDPATSELHVRYRKGGTSIYSGVPADLAQQISTAYSVGKALHEQVRGKFPHRGAEDE